MLVFFIISMWVVTVRIYRDAGMNFTTDTSAMRRPAKAIVA
jgi:hypothetical protein